MDAPRTDLADGAVRRTAAELGAAIAAGETTSEQVTSEHLDRIAAVDGGPSGVHAFLHVGARAGPRGRPRRRRAPAAGERLGPLAGVPVAVKDVVATTGMPTTCGSADPRGLGAAVRRDAGHAAARRRPGDPGQDEHGRVRDGLVDGVLRLRPDPQPLGPGTHPGRLGRRLRRCRRRLRGADRGGHRHGRVDPPAGGRHRDRRRQADVRRRLPLRAGRPRVQPRPGRPVLPDGAGRRTAARGHRRPRSDGLHEPARAPRRR